jgi:transcriptional regulator with PAS, ATPase and Fis domain
MGKLQSIQTVAQHVVSAIATAMGVDVAMIDEDCCLVATSKAFLEKRGTDINKKFIAHVLARDTFVLPNPGYSQLCAGCHYEGNCPETAEVLQTIRYDGNIIGVMLMVAYTRRQKEKILNNTSELLEFLREMAKLTCNEIRLRETLETEKVTRQHLESTINFADNGIISINRRGSIIQLNHRAAELLKIRRKNAMGMQLDSFIPQQVFSGIVGKGKSLKRYEVIGSGQKPLHLLVSGNPVTVEAKTVGAVLSIKDIRDVQKDIFEFSEKQIEYTFADIHGNSTVINTVKEYAKRIAGTESTILIQGESGTGKELFARAIHSSSRRATLPFIPINCAAIPESLLESELFGYDDGAFSGARRGGKPGKFEMAGGGTIFLDEIGDMPLHMQAKLLRVLQEKVIERIGSVKSIPVDIRIIAATNRDLRRMVRKNEFREDLFFRLNVMPLQIPPLRQRRDDILSLAVFFLKKYCGKFQRNIEDISLDVYELLRAYHWPGNARELENTMEYAVNIETGTVISQASLPSIIARGEIGTAPEKPLAAKVRRYERVLITEALDEYGHSLEGKKRTAKELGISLPTLYRKIGKCDSDPVK